jgi:hypothetical protein
MSTIQSRLIYCTGLKYTRLPSTTRFPYWSPHLRLSEQNFACISPLPCALNVLLLSRARLTDYRRGLNWWMDLLTTYTHDSEVQAITALPQHTLNLFRPAVSSPTVPWQQLLTVEIPQLHVLRFDLHSLVQNSVSNLVAPTVFKTTLRHGPYRKHHSSIVACVFIAAGTYLASCCLETAVVYSPISQPFINIIIITVQECYVSYY